MAGEPENLVLEHLRAIRSELQEIRQDQREERIRSSAMERAIASLQMDIAGVNLRLDRLNDRVRTHRTPPRVGGGISQSCEEAPNGREAVILLAGFFIFRVPSQLANAAWPTQAGTYTTTTSNNIPLFPRKLNGYIAKKDQDFWGKPFQSRGMISGFSGAMLARNSKLPNTMNGCSSGIFMIRWRSAYPEILVEFSVRYSAENSAAIKTGAFGYMMGSNCEQPLFSFDQSVDGNGSNLVDIYYELKFWQAAP